MPVVVVVVVAGGLCFLCLTLSRLRLVQAGALERGTVLLGCSTVAGPCCRLPFFLVAVPLAADPWLAVLASLEEEEVVVVVVMVEVLSYLL